MMNTKFDLNLIRVFCTLYDTGSLTKTADYLEISQPAISHSLKKLRAFYDDELFVRNDGKMLPTILAEQLAPNLKRSYDLIRHSLYFNKNNLKKVKSNYIFSMSDISQTYFIPALCMLLDGFENTNIDIKQVEQKEIKNYMREGQVDFAIGHIPVLQDDNTEIVCEKLFEDKFVFMVRDGHPLIQEDEKFNYEDLQLLGVKSAITGHTELIKKINREYEKNIILTISNYSVAPEIVDKTDLGVIIPLSFAKKFNYDGQFKTFDIQMNRNIIDINLYYHKVYAKDLSIKWMSNLIIDNFRNERRI